MKFHLFILLAALATGIPVKAQQKIAKHADHFTDSVKALIEAARSDTARASQLHTLADYWSERDSSEAVDFAMESLKLSKGYPLYEAISRHYLAGALFYYDPGKSKQQYMKAIEMLEGNNSTIALRTRAKAWHNYGALVQREGDEEGFMSVLMDKVIPLTRRAGDVEHEAYIYKSIGVILANTGNTPKSTEYFRRFIHLARNFPGGRPQLADAYINIARNQLQDEQVSAAASNLDSAWSLLQNTAASLELADYHLTRGMYDLKMKKWEAALGSLGQALDVATQLNQPYLASNIRFEIYNVYKDSGQPGRARRMLLTIYRDSLSDFVKENRLVLLFNLATIHAATGDIGSAYEWLLKHKTEADSAFEKRLSSDIAELEIKYQSEKKQREIITLKSENRQTQLDLQRNRFLNILLGAGIFLLLVVSGFILILYRNKRRGMLQAKQLHEHQLRQLAQDEQLKIYNAIMEGQEQERTRMARDLHDGLGGMLSGIRLKLSGIVENGKVEQSDLRYVIEQLDNSVREIRHIAHNMMPEVLIRFGVESALRDLCNSLKSATLDIEFQAFRLKKNLSHQIQIMIYRIIQELLNNAVKHSNASKIIVQCSQNAERIFITVEDNGDGFDAALPNRDRGIGLTNIQNRISYLNGTIDIDTSEGEGTVINVELDCHE